MFRMMLSFLLIGFALGAQVVQEAFRENPGPLDFIRGEGHEQAILQALTGDALVGLNPQGQPVPRLAMAWVAIPEGWRFRLREGCTFADGSPVGVQDVLWTFREILAKQEAGRTKRAILEGLAFKASGAELEVTGARNSYRILMELARIPIARQGNPAMGSGPFVLAQRGAVWQLKARPTHFLAPKVAGFHFRLIQEDQGVLQQVRKGWLSLAVPPARGKLQPPAGYSVLQQPTHAQMLMWSQLGTGSLRWIERWRVEAFPSGFLGTHVSPSRGLWPESLGFPSFKLAAGPLPELRGQRWELIYGAGDELGQRALQALRERAKADGLDLVLRPLEPAVLMERISTGKFQLACAFQLFDPHPWAVLEYLEPEGPLNFTRWSHPQVKALCQKLGRPGEDRRWAQLEAIWSESAAAMPLLDFHSLVWVDARLKVEPSPLGLYLTTPGPAGWRWVP